MPLLFRNVTVWTQRRSLTAATNQTQGAEDYLVAVPGYLSPNTARTDVTLPDAAFAAEYFLRVESGTDIARGDYLSKITLPNGLTPWPNERVAPPEQSGGLPGATNTVWEVVWARESAPGLLASREVWLSRKTLGGREHL